MHLARALLLGFLALGAGGQTPQLVRDIVPGSGGSMPAVSVAIHDQGAVVIFSADDGQTGIEPWRTDGTPAGTRPLADLNPGSASSHPGPFVTFGDRVFFNAYTVTTGHELFVTDGSAAGTQLLVDLRPGPANSNPGALLPFRDRLLFLADDGTGGGWFQTDGTAAGTARVVALPTLGLRSWAIAGNQLFFFLDIGSAHELWVWPGSGPPALVRSFPQVASNPPPAALLEFGGRLVLRVVNPGQGEQLWSSDGTAAGTVMISPGTWFPYNVCVTGDQLFYVDRRLSLGLDLRVTDGTAAGDRSVRVFRRAASAPVALGDRVALVGDDGFSGPAPLIFVSDGTAAGTTSIGRTGRALTAVGTRHLVFVGNEAAAGDELWLTDGTAARTRRVADLNPGAASAFPPLAVLHHGAGRLWCWADDGVKGLEPRVVHLGAGARALGLGSAAGILPALRGSDPVLGGSFDLVGRSPLPGAAGLTILGVRPAAPLVIVPGWTLLVDPTGPHLTLGVTTGGTGAWSHPGLAVPNTPVLDGATLAAQTVLLDAAAPLGLALTNGVQLTLGF